MAQQLARLGMAGLALLAAGRAEAAGFALKEQSAAAQGNAFAGAAAGDGNPSAMFFNPATLGLVQGMQVENLVTLIVPTLEVSRASGRTGAGTPITGRDQIDDAGENVAVPALYAVLPLGEDWRFGLGINAPFGLETSYQNDWVGRYHALRSRLKTIDVNPAISWRAADWLFLGAGFQAQYADAYLSQAIDTGTLGAGAGIPGAVPGEQDSIARIQGHDWSYGYTLGAVVVPRQGTRIGLGYRSSIDHRLEGRADFSLDQDGIGQAIQGATGAFQKTDVHAPLRTPPMVSLGLRQDLSPTLALHAGVDWTGWSSFDELVVGFENPSQPTSVTEQKWNDVWSFSLGATWKSSDTLTWRGGIAYDQSPTTDKHRTPRVPDGDRYWLSVGVGWTPLPWLDVDAGITHIFMDGDDVDLGADDPGNAGRGELSVRYDNMIDLFTVGARMRF